MIARIWHGRTRSADFERYSAFLTKVAIPDYQRTPGFLGLTFLRRLDGDAAHFTLITYWPDLETIHGFAGAEVDKAKYYPEDKAFLLEFEEHVVHHEVFARQG